MRLRAVSAVTIEEVRAAAPRFWPKVTKSDGCWTWIGATDGHGYGQFNVGGRSVRSNLKAHRVAYMIAKGEIPPGLHVLHACDNPPCVNPEHLSVGDRSENMRQCVDRGRHGNEPARPPKGERHWRARLTQAQVDEMRRLRAESGLPYAAIANRFGVGTMTAWSAITRHSYEDLEAARLANEEGA